MEDAVLARDSEAYTHEEKGTESHESGDSPVLQDVSSGNKDDCKMESAHPVASVCSYVYLTCRGIKEHIGVRVQLSGSDQVSRAWGGEKTAVQTASLPRLTRPNISKDAEN